MSGMEYFNSLPHAEVDDKAQQAYNDAVSFQLTTSRRGRQRSICNAVLEGHFNSLPHAEVDDFACNGTAADQYFNSLPHAEVDRNGTEPAIT